jgi:hypothetical protein
MYCSTIEYIKRFVAIGERRANEEFEMVEVGHIPYDLQGWAHYFPHAYSMAFAAVYGYLHVPCDECNNSETIKWYVDGLKLQRHIFCYECAHVAYTRELRYFINEKSYPDHLAPPFFNYVSAAKDIVRGYMTYRYCPPIPGKTGASYELRPLIDVNSRFLCENEKQNGTWGRFLFFLEGILGYHIAMFLLDKKQRDLLKICPTCQRFFLAVRRTKIYCSDSCGDGSPKGKARKRKYHEKHKLDIEVRRAERER